MAVRILLFLLQMKQGDIEVYLRKKTELNPVSIVWFFIRMKLSRNHVGNKKQVGYSARTDKLRSLVWFMQHTFPGYLQPKQLM